MVRIAVVDDDPVFADMMRDVFGVQGWDMIAFSRSRGILPALAQTRPDVIVLDIWMEEEDSGWILLDQLREDPRTAGIPVVICSEAGSDVEGHMMRLRLHAVPFVDKPFDIEEMVQIVEALLGSADTG